MQILSPNYFLLLLMSSFLMACSDSADAVKSKIPDDPFAGGGEEVTTENVVFQGVWFSDCKPENVGGYRSSQSKFHFEGDDLSVSTQYYFEDSCIDAGVVDEMKGPYSLSNEKTSGDNLLVFDAELDSGDVMTLYMRTMMLNDGTFIVTKFKTTEEAASKATADTPLSRDNDWTQIQENQ